MEKGQNKKGKLVVISGPSGVGKGTICKQLVRRLNDVCLSISATTRPKAKTEVDGKDYYFLPREQFEKRIKECSLLEYAEVFGNFYGTPKDKVDEATAAGKTVILEIDVQGGRQVKAKCPDAVMIFIMPPTTKALVERITGRGRDAADVVQKRLAKANAEIEAAGNLYEYKIVNDDLEQAINEVMEIIRKANGDKK
ncbi:MAG: guanylate kinase [Planctomycetota bacterium]|nr:guanylate kinase [Planctomycetota bacterium]